MYRVILLLCVFAASTLANEPASANDFPQLKSDPPYEDEKLFGKGYVCVFVFGFFVLPERMQTREAYPDAKVFGKATAPNHRLDFAIGAISPFITIVPDSTYPTGVYGTTYLLSLEKYKIFSKDRESLSGIRDTRMVTVQVNVDKDGKTLQTKCSTAVALKEPTVKKYPLPADRRPEKERVYDFAEAYEEAGFPQSYIKDFVTFTTTGY